MVPAPIPKNVQAVREVLKGSPLVLSVAQRNYLKKTMGISDDTLLVHLAAAVAEYSISPQSNFQVGAAGLASSGKIYLGVNLEFLKTSQVFNVHAEMFLMTNLANAQESSLDSVAIVAYKNRNWKKPMGAMCCGICRQFLAEAALYEKTRVLTPGKKVEKLIDLFKHPFGGTDLGNTKPLLKSNRKTANLKQNTLLEYAKNGLARSYTPKSYSGSNPSGIAIETKEKDVYEGFFIENVSYIACMSPLQVALVLMHTQKPDLAFESIARAHFVEKKDAQVSQIDTTQSILKSVAPKATLSISLI